MNSYYEKFTDGRNICIDDELPFDIPENWCWCRLREIFSMQAGKNIMTSKIFDFKSSEHPYLCYGGNGVRGYVENNNQEGAYPLIGRQGALCGNIKKATGKFYATEHAVVVTLFSETNVDWACLFLKALNLNQFATATAQPGLAVSKIISVFIPLPPLLEQERIIRKYESIKNEL